MASKLALSLVIGGAVASSVGSAFKTVTDGISKLEQKGNKTKVLKGTIGETIKLRDEWKKAHDSGSASAAGLLRRLDANLDALRKQGVQVGRLDKEYQRLGRTAKGLDLQVKGRQQLGKGKEGAKTVFGQTTAAVAAVAIPTMISAGYQATIRDIAIKAGVANQPQEQDMAKRIIQVSQDNGMSRDGVADLVNQLVGAGMDLDKALSYADVAAKFAVGQGSSGEDTAKMIQALEQNAKISDPNEMKKTLEGIALQGQAGSFEASDMARWFPVLLASMEKTGSTGPEAVAQLGAMLQVQMKTAGNSDEAANNLKNWIEKIGAGDVVDAYKKAGIDYQASLNTGIQKGMSVLESSMALAQKYVQTTDPAKAKKMAEAQAKIDKEVDPKKALKALEALEQSLKTGDIFADMQVKAALTAYGQNRGLYEQLKKDAQDEKKAGGILDKNLQERRETSAQMWIEAKNDLNEAMRSIGDAIRPATDAAAKGVSWLAKRLVSLSDGTQAAVMGIGVLVAGFLALKSVIAGAQVAKGLANLGRGRALERMAGRGGRFVDDVVEPAAAKPRGQAVERKPGLLGRLRGASNDSAPGPAESAPKVPEIQKVFVVNADSIGKTVRAPEGTSGRRRRPRRRPGRAGRERAAAAPAGAPGRVSPDRPPVPAESREVRVSRPAAAPTVSEPPRLSMAPPAPAAPRLNVPAAVAPAPVATGGRLGEMVRGARSVTKLGRGLPGGNLLGLALGAVDVATTAETRDEKAEGYGGVAGGMAGTMAGMAAGAAIGSVVPVIGTAVGAAVGGVIGGMGGEIGGAWLGKFLFGEKKPEAEASPEDAVKTPAPGEALRAVADAAAAGRDAQQEQARSTAATPSAAPGDALRSSARRPGAGQEARKESAKVAAVGAAAPGDVVRSIASEAPPAPAAAPVLAKAPEPARAERPKVDQVFSFAPQMPVTVQGDAKDPQQLAAVLFPYVQRMFEDFARQQQARQLSDEPHV